MEKKKLLERAYKLGYFVGYYGHTEWVLWIIEEKERIYSKAKALGVYNEAKEAYMLGKKEGAEKREEIINKGLSIKPEEEIKMLKTIKSELSEAVIEEQKLHYLAFLKSPEIIDSPRLLEIIKLVDKPKILNLPDFLKG